MLVLSFEVFIHARYLHCATHFICLVPARRRLARLQLVEIPPADGQVAAVLIHTLAEAVDILCAHARRLLVHLRSVCVGGVVVLGSGLCGRGASATEETADCMPDRGADCDTTVA